MDIWFWLVAFVAASAMVGLLLIDAKASRLQRDLDTVESELEAAKAAIERLGRPAQPPPREARSRSAEKTGGPARREDAVPAPKTTPYRRRRPLDARPI